MSEQAAPPRFLTFPIVAALILALTAARVVVLTLTQLDLHGDEAQYWAWSRQLDLGYYSKPPLIAWAIAATTSIFGNDEWAVRLLAPFAHALAAFALYELARRMYDARAGALAAIGWMLMPGVQLSSFIISTDALMLPLHAAALLCLWRLTETRDWRWAVALGVAFGFGVLAKYATFYFLLGAGLAALWTPRVRVALLSKEGGFALSAAGIVIAPNLFWNAQHRFDTVAHTADNAALGSNLFNPDQLLTFITDQFGVLGPLFFGALLLWLLPRAAMKPKQLSEQDRFLLAFVIPPLLIIAVQALLSRANANWAAAAYPAAIVWLAGRFSTGRGLWLHGASTAIHGVLQAIVIAGLISLPLADKLGFANSIKRARNWEETATLIADKVKADGQLTAIAVDNRLMFYDLTYYWRDAPPTVPLRMWLLEDEAGNSAEQNAALRNSESGRVLVVLMNPDHVAFVKDDFVHAVDAGSAEIALGPKKKRGLTFLLASAYSRAPRDDDFKQRLAVIRGEATE